MIYQRVRGIKLVESPVLVNSDSVMRYTPSIASCRHGRLVAQLYDVGLINDV